MQLKISEAAKELGVSVGTLRRWEKEGLITSERTPKGHRRYDLNKLRNEVIDLKTNEDNKDKKTIIYARVSTPTAKEDLNYQKRMLELFCSSKGWTFETITDIGSGLNYNKPGLNKVIDLIERNKVDQIVIAYKDRLLRYGYELLETVCKYHNINIIVVNKTDDKTYEEELVDDVLSIITVYSAKLYGSRSHKNKEIVDNNKKMFGKKL